MIKNFLKLRLNAGLWRDVLQHTNAVNNARQRTFFVGCGMAFFYLLLGVRLADVMVLKAPSNSRQSVVSEIDPNTYKRHDIVDRNGEVLATQIVTASVYAEPKNILDAREAAEKLATVFPDIGFDTLFHKLQQSGKSFIWIARHVTPKVQDMIYRLGVPGVHLQTDYKRVYPHGDLCAHVLGGCDVDGCGHSGVELKFDDYLRSNPDNKPLKLAIDIRVQHMIADVLSEAIKEFKAIGGNVILMRVSDGQILSMVSLPSFDPNKPTQGVEAFNRNTMGVYEPGSTFKIINTAIALESGKIKPGMLFDVRFPIQIGKNKVDDFRGAKAIITFEQAFVKSSNIAAIQQVRMFGARWQHECFKRFGIFEPVSLELPEKSLPLHPDRWTDVTSWTASYGYGVAVAPIRTLTVISSLLNDGWEVKPTLMYSDDGLSDARVSHTSSPKQFVSAETSAQLRQLMRMAAVGKKADVEGLNVIGKSGTTYKRQGSRGYGSDGGRKRITSFIGAYPENRPQYVLMVNLDEPQAVEGTHGFAAAGWNAAPTAGKILARISTVLPVDMSAVSLVQETKDLPSSRCVEEG